MYFAAIYKPYCSSIITIRTEASKYHTKVKMLCIVMSYYYHGAMYQEMCHTQINKQIYKYINSLFFLFHMCLVD